MENDPLLSVVVLNWNGWPLAARCLESVLRSEPAPFALIVLDNASDDDSWRRCIEWFESATRTRLPGADVVPGADLEEIRQGVGAAATRLVIGRTRANLGYAGGCNVGARLAISLGSQYVAVLNNDTVLDKSALQELVAVSRGAGAAVVGARIVDMETGADQDLGASWPALLFGIRRVSAPESRYWATASVCGAAMLLTADVVAGRTARTGSLFDPRYFMYCEDTDLCLDARRHGLRCVVAGGARARHARAASSGGMLNPRSYYYLTRNRLLLARAHLGAVAAGLFLPCYAAGRLLAMARNLAAGRWRAVRAIWEGLADGLAGRTGKWLRHDAP